MPGRRELLAALSALPLLAGKSGTLPDSIRTAAAAKVTHEPFGELAVYYEGPTDQLRGMTTGSLRLKPGMSPHPPHQHPEEEIMIVTEGTGEISVNGKITKVGPGAMMYCGAQHLHGIVNTGREPLLFYYFKWQA